MDSKHRTEILQIGADHGEYIDQIVAMTAEFSSESHIYDQLGFNPEKFKRYILAHTQAPASIYATKRGETITGYALFYLDSTYIDAVNFEIITIYVPPAHRKSDAGRSLADALVKTMDINGCKYGQVSICCAMKENEELINMLTQNMFRKLGFYKIGVIMGRKGLSWDC